MIKITKDEAMFLRENGFADMVKHSYSKRPTLFVVEERRALRALANYRNSRVVWAKFR